MARALLLALVNRTTRSFGAQAIAILFATACGGRNATTSLVDRADASSSLDAKVDGFVTSCVGQPCGTRCIGDGTDPNPPNPVEGWCDNTLIHTVNGDVIAGCRTPPEILCNEIPCSVDSDCLPFVGQDHWPECNDPSILAAITPKCLQHFCRYVHWPICPEGGDGSRFFHYDPNATTCEQLLPQIQTLAETVRACDPTRDAGSHSSCYSSIEAPCCWFFVDDELSSTVLDYLGRISQADDLGCKWKTCSDSTCPPPAFDHVNCETVSGRPVCVPH